MASTSDNMGEVKRNANSDEACGLWSSSNRLHALENAKSAICIQRAGNKLKVREKTAIFFVAFDFELAVPV